jgi:phosphatidylethanolamine/phosphatidyl-N-methylethanolamine N-methyltransferase
MSKLKFVKNFIKKPISTGAIWPTGIALAEEISRYIQTENDSYVAEIGPGTGAITSRILPKLGTNTHFFAVELNPEFYTHLKEIFPNTTLYNENATNLSKILKQEKIDELDAIISGLPWASFPYKLQTALLDAITKSLKPGGCFSTFAYLQGLYLPAGIKFKKLLSEYFSEINISKIVWNNIPPSIVYHCKK